jgi:hypothetical protein
MTQNQRTWLAFDGACWGALALQAGILLILLVIGVPRLGLLWFAAASLVLNAALAAWAYWRIGQPFSEE